MGEQSDATFFLIIATDAVKRIHEKNENLHSDAANKVSIFIVNRTKIVTIILTIRI